MSEATSSRKRADTGLATAELAAPVRSQLPGELVGDSELTRGQVDELAKRLEEQRATLVASIEERREQERENVGREVGDEMDDANAEGQTSMTSKLLERDARMVSEIDRALAKVREGTFGMCEGTGEPIGWARLSLRPWARYSVEYQEELEREAKTRGV